MTDQCLFLFQDTLESTGQSSLILFFRSKLNFYYSVFAEGSGNWKGNQIFHAARMEEFCCGMPLDRSFMINLQKSLTFSPLLILKIFSMSAAIFNCCSQNRTTGILTQSQKHDSSFSYLVI